VIVIFLTRMDEPLFRSAHTEKARSYINVGVMRHVISTRRPSRLTTCWPGARGKTHYADAHAPLRVLISAQSIASLCSFSK